ncbi:MAG: ABC transporter permease [Anaerolineales bacterium]|nr:ABC transporter permease [Anaerolineales bacterium]MDW8161538.1 ABC transporter permease [Anaerolineales bacterium]
MSSTSLSKPIERPHIPTWRRIIENQWFLLLIVVFLISGVTGYVNPRYFMQQNLMNILEQISVLGLVAAGATILIIAGNFDISVGSMIGLSACIMAILINRGVNEFLVGVIGVLVCILCATLNGVLSVVFRTPSFIISLAMMGVYHGIALALTQGVIQTIYGRFEFIASTKLLGFFPLLFFISILGYLFVHIILKYTQIGRRVFAIGNNPRAAFLAGINVPLNTILFFFLNGILVGMASVLILSRLGAALPSTGSGLELRAIGAVVIGGVPITGGRGNILGTFLGVLLMGVISNSLNMMRVNPYFQEVAYGLLIIFAVAISSIRYRWLGAR